MHRAFPTVHLHRSSGPRAAAGAARKPPGGRWFKGKEVRPLWALCPGKAVLGLNSQTARGFSAGPCGEGATAPGLPAEVDDLTNAHPWAVCVFKGICKLSECERNIKDDAQPGCRRGAHEVLKGGSEPVRCCWLVPRSVNVHRLIFKTDERQHRTRNTDDEGAKNQ